MGEIRITLTLKGGEAPLQFGKMKFETKVVRAGEKPEKITGAITTPIYQTATYVLDEVGKLKGGEIRKEGFDYSRTTHPTKVILENKLNALEGGSGAIAFSSGMAAITALMHTLSSGDHVIFCEDIYGGTYRLLTKIMNKFNLKSSFVDMVDLSKLENTIEKNERNTKMVFIETPTNPLLKIYDIKEIAKISHEHQLPLIVDNTFMTPYFQKPFKLGADTIVHSLTKYLAGHNDLIGGAIISKDKKLIEELQFIEMSTGPLLGPFDSWLTIRGLKTLALRMSQHDKNGRKIAQFLEKHKKVNKVIYPGLKSHPQYELAKKQMSGFGGMISFEVKGGLESAKVIMKEVKLWSLAESLGGVESLITHPATMTHASLTKEERESRDITDSLIRLSVGIEDADDLIDDLEQALDKI